MLLYPTYKISIEFLYEKRQNKTHHYRARGVIVKGFQCIQVSNSLIPRESDRERYD
jgi:hypothetical protein